MKTYPMCTITLQPMTNQAGYWLKISGHYSGNKDPQFEGGQYRREVARPISERQRERLIDWMFAKPGRIGSTGNSWYQVYE